MNFTMENVTAEEMYKRILDSTNESIAFISTEQKILALNKAITETFRFHFSKELAIGEDFRNYILPENKDFYTDSIAKAFNGETTHHITQIKTEKSLVWFEIQMIPVFLSNGNLFGISLIGRNIDKEKRDELELENLAENYEAVIQNTNESIILLNTDFKILRFNRAIHKRLLQTLGKEIYIGADFRDFVYPDKKSIFMEQFENALNGITPEYEVHTFAIDKSDIWFLSKMYPVYKRNGQLLGIALFSINIKERKEAEIALKESEEKFRVILESVPLPIVIMDKEMKIVLSNPETEMVFGYSSRELFNQQVQILIPDSNIKDDLFTLGTFLKKPETYNKGINKYVKTYTKNGKEIIIEVRLNCVEIKNEEFILLIIEDVTERINAEKKILNQLKSLEAIAWQQSHEVRRPVANILGITEILKSDDISDDERKQYLGYLYQVTEELDKIIHKIIIQSTES